MKTRVVVRDYDLSGTLESGQAFRWRQLRAANPKHSLWEGVVRDQWIRIETLGSEWQIETFPSSGDWWRHYLRIDENLPAILQTFPNDPAMQAAVAACPGLRLLRQDPWECLASFICSSTKQIVQIQEIIRILCDRHGRAIHNGRVDSGWKSFPTFEEVARLRESELRACKMGFRAPYLLATAKRAANGILNLDALGNLDLEDARRQLMECPGVGRKIADCVLLFAFGFQQAFPVDVWVRKAVARLYFPTARKLNARRIEQFARTHFGPNAGYAQQYLFHHARKNLGRGIWPSSAPTR